MWVRLSSVFRFRQRACESGVAQIMDALIAEVGKDRLGVRLSPFGGASQARPRAALSCCGAEPVRAWRAAVQAAAFACAVCLAVFWWLGSRRSSDADAALCKAQSHASRCDPASRQALRLCGLCSVATLSGGCNVHHRHGVQKG